MSGKGKRSGFTLVELIIYIALTAVVLVALLQVALTVVSSGTKTQTKTEVQQNVRYAMSRVMQTTRSAQEVQSGSSIFGSSSGRLVLSMSGTTVDPTIFFLSGSQIFVSEGGTATGAITSLDMIVDELRFTNVTATGATATIVIAIHAQDRMEGATSDFSDVYELESSVTLRR